MARHPRQPTARSRRCRRTPKYRRRVGGRSRGLSPRKVPTHEPTEAGPSPVGEQCFRPRPLRHDIPKPDPTMIRGLVSHHSGRRRWEYRGERGRLGRLGRTYTAVVNWQWVVRLFSRPRFAPVWHSTPSQVPRAPQTSSTEHRTQNIQGHLGIRLLLAESHHGPRDVAEGAWTASRRLCR